MRGDRVIPRWRDERVLDAIRMKIAGATWPKIAAALGFSSFQSVQQACTSVLHADKAESGEDVSQCYW